MVCSACGDNTMRQEYSASDFYLQLKNYKRLFSFEIWHQKLQNERYKTGKFKLLESRTHVFFSGTDIQKIANQLIALRSSKEAYVKCANIVQAYMSNSAFNCVNISSIFTQFK